MSIFSNPKGEAHNQGLNSPGNGVRPNTTPIARKTSPDVISTLGHGMRVTGNIVCEGSLQIFGCVIGDLHASQLVICEGAQVEGNIIAHETSIQGSFKGTIHSNSVKLQSKAVVEGEIHNKSLTIEPDVQFEGVSRRLEKPVDALSSAFSSAVTDELRAAGGELSH